MNAFLSALVDTLPFLARFFPVRLKPAGKIEPLPPPPRVPTETRPETPPPAER